MNIPRRLMFLLACLFVLEIGLFSNQAAAMAPFIKMERGGEQSSSDTRVFPQPLILIDAGHGGIDGGTSYQNILEKDINLAIAQKLYLLLRDRGVAAVLNRTGDYALSEHNRWSASRSRHLRDLAQRRQLSEELPITAYISLHVNWGRHSTTRGAIVLHQQQESSVQLANIIQQHLNALYGSEAQHEPTYGKTYYLLRTVKQPAVIVETGFISNTLDRELLTSAKGQTIIAERICTAIIQYLSMPH